MNWVSLLDRLESRLQSLRLLEPHAHWVVGVSGGPDSVLLLHALHALNIERRLQWQLHVAHLHHGIRAGEADADADFVRSLAADLGLRYDEERTDIPARVAAEGGSTEDVARRSRYEFLERVALLTASECVAVAHHADDNAETILHRICRGTGLRGLGGMGDVRAIQPGSRVRLVRPFLEHRREAIEALCRERGLAYRIDASNLSEQFTRGRIRNRVLPMLQEQLNPNVADALLRLGEQARWLGTYLEDSATRIFDSMIISEGPGRIVLNTLALASKQPIIQAEVIRRALALVLGRDQDLGFSHVEAVLRLAADGSSGKELHLPGPVVVRKQYDRLEIAPLQATPLSQEPELQSLFVQCPGCTPIPALSGELRVELCSLNGEHFARIRKNMNRHEEWIDVERVRLPLMIRARRDGDRFWPLGAPGAKTLSDFFIDEKLDPRLRARTGVLCDQDGPVWVIPLRIDERVKIRPTSRQALHLVLTHRQPRATTGS